MKRLAASISLLCMVFLSATGAHAQSGPPSRPNILYIFADDLGYGDLGCYGQTKIETPHIDSLAAAGMLFTQHYVMPVCAPSRYCLMTGLHSGHAYIRGNHEWGARGNVWSFQAMETNPSLEGQWPIPDTTLTVGKLLQSKGYRTALVGKWGLGGPESTGIPNRQGFDYFFGSLCQRQDHQYYPAHLWEDIYRVPLNNNVQDPAIRFPAGLDPNDSANYAAYSQEDYAPDLMLDAALRFLDSCKHKPFFLYFASPLPHASMQAPRRWVDYYHKKFGDEKPFGGDSYVPCQYPRATRAAMISLLDEQVGLLIQKLKAMGVYDHTLIIFSSDNGASNEGGADCNFFKSNGPFKNEFGWGKGFLYEGGIREPLIAVWPGKIQAGSRSDLVTANWDFLPTACQLAGIPVPKHIDGISYLPTLLGKDKQQQTHRYLYWEFPANGGQQAVRMGPWKAIRFNVDKGNRQIKLFNLDKDPREQEDVADQHPDLLKEMADIMRREHQPPQVARFRMKTLDTK